MGVIAASADRVTGHASRRIRGSRPGEDIFLSPQHPYTRMLLDRESALGQPTRQGHINLKPLSAADERPTLLTVVI